MKWEMMNSIVTSGAFSCPSSVRTSLIAKLSKVREGGAYCQFFYGKNDASARVMGANDEMG